MCLYFGAPPSHSAVPSLLAIPLIFMPYNLLAPGALSFQLCSYQSSHAKTILCKHSSITLQPHSHSSISSFFSPSHFKDITDSKYYAQMICLTFQSITIMKQKFKPHISCTVVIDKHRNLNPTSPALW